MAPMMIEETARLNIVRIGSDITFSSLKEIGNKLLDSFLGVIEEFDLSHHNTPFIDSIDAQLLTMVLFEEVGGHTLGITDADLKTAGEDEFYNSIIGGKNTKNDVAVVSTRQLCPEAMASEDDYDLYLNRTLKVSIHEVGHNLGLTDHAAYKTAASGALCPMSKGEFNKFGYTGYVRAIVDGRGVDFCDECRYFLKTAHGKRKRLGEMLKDGLEKMRLQHRAGDRALITPQISNLN